MSPYLLEREEIAGKKEKGRLKTGLGQIKRVKNRENADKRIQ